MMIFTANTGATGCFFKTAIAEIEAATKIQAAGDFEVLLSNGDKKIYQTGSVEADSSFFKVFPYKIIQGNASTLLDKPNAIVISQEVATKLFGTTNPLGKLIKIFNAIDCEVTGIMQEPATPSHLNGSLFIAVHGKNKLSGGKITLTILT